MSTLGKFIRLRDNLIRMNIYQNDLSLSLNHQELATRLYFSFLMFSSMILLMFTGLSSQTSTVNLISPSINQFDLLSNVYSSTLSCVCSKPTIAYDSFLSFAPEYHQICSSEFVSQSWITSLFLNNVSFYFALDFRKSASSQFQILAFICSTIPKFVQNLLKELSEQQLITRHVLSRSTFEAQAAALAQQTQMLIVDEITRMDRFVSKSIFGNSLFSALNTNYFVYITPGIRSYSVYSASYFPNGYQLPVQSNVYCDCALTSSCTAPSAFFDSQINITECLYLVPILLSEFSVPGFRVGCLPRTALFQSTLACFYDSNCLNRVQTFFGDNSTRQPLDNTRQSRFELHTTIETMFMEIFIETWHYQSNYIGYFNACAPASCSYSYTQNFNLLPTLITFLGLIGGLTLILYSISPIVIKFIFYKIPSMVSNRRNDLRRASLQTVPQSTQNLRNRLANFVEQIKTKINKFNYFDDSALLLNERQGLWATRLYFLFYLVAILILILYSFVIMRTITVKIVEPSREDFNRIYNQYSLTLSCPCTQLSIPYSKFITIDVRFHEICSSDFIRDDRWLLYFDFTPTISNFTVYTVFFPLDFRRTPGRSLFRYMQTLCLLANETVLSSRNAFYNTKLVSAEPLSNVHFNTHISLLIQQFREQTLASFISSFSLVRFSIEDNQLYVSSGLNFEPNMILLNDSWTFRFISRLYTRTNNESCSCLISNDCSRPQGFYLSQNEILAHNAQPDHVVPGFVVSCFPMSSFLLSTFECLYNQSCIQLLLDLRLAGMEHMFQSIQFNISSLNSSLPSRYSPTTMISEILSNLMIEDWINTTDVNAHYENCKPHICTFTYKDRFGILQVITSLIGLASGLSLSLRLLIPLLIKIILHQDIHRQIGIITLSQRNNESSRHSMIQNLITRISRIFVSMNVFHTRIEVPIFVTRIYLLLLIVCFSVILLFTGLETQTHSRTVLSPSELNFDSLNKLYEKQSLSCPCSQNSISYGTFVSISTTFHQICSSDFTQSNWWTVGVARGDSTRLKDRPLFSIYFRMLASLCSLANQTIINSRQIFISNKFISVETLARDTFQNQIESSVNQFIQQTQSKFVRSQKFISETFRSNHIQNIFMTTWKHVFTTSLENYLVAAVPITYDNDTCSCAQSLSPTCRKSLIFVLPNVTTTITLPGIIGSCTPVDGLRQSTLECFYDSQCLNTMKLLFNTSLIPDSLNINSSFSSRFPYMTTSIGELIDQLFVELWIHNINYSSYYIACSPNHCHYTFNTRNNILYMITTLLGFYGGLTVTIRFLVLHSWLMPRKIKNWWRNDNYPIITVVPK